MSRTQTLPRIWRYEVTRVWGSMVGRVDVGQVIYDKWNANRDWFMMNFTTMSEGGFGGKLLGEAEPEKTAEVHASWARGRAEQSEEEG